MEAIDWNKKIKEALERTDIMALSTIGEDGSWTCPVHFNYDKNFELSFQSMPNTKHVKNILKDPRVSVAIYHPDASANGGHLGLQIKGTAKLVSKDEWLRFKIAPDEVWYFNSKNSSSREKIDLTKLKL